MGCRDIEQATQTGEQISRKLEDIRSEEKRDMIAMNSTCLRCFNPSVRRGGIDGR